MEYFVKYMYVKVKLIFRQKKRFLRCEIKLKKLLYIE